jgi:DDE superfamily endonuclease
MSPTPTQSNGLSSPAKQHKVHKAHGTQVAASRQLLFVAQARQRGPKAGTKNVRNNKTRGDWYIACHKYRNMSKKMSQKQFLKSSESGGLFNGSASEQMAFGRFLRQFDDGSLTAMETTQRSTCSKFPEVEKMLVQYMELRAKLYKRDKCGAPWWRLADRARKCARSLGIPESDFSASAGWISATLSRHSMVKLNLHGEAGDMDDNERAAIMDKWRKEECWPLIEKYRIPMERIYNADQTGLYYQKLPNTLYVDQKNRKNYQGAKQMKDKNRITLMLCTAANGMKVPLAVVGKAKMPVCFSLCENSKPPIAYTSQSNAWFDRHITWWWLKEVFMPHHTSRFGHGHCIMLLDNCSAHKIEESILPPWLHILFLPPNVTNKHQPADMGMIAALKAGYKTKMLSGLLDLFDAPGGYEAAAEARKRAKRGQRGLSVGGKAHIIDAMNILNGFWSVDGRYALIDGIRRCWRKADILPLEMNLEIYKDLGSLSIPAREKVLSAADCSKLCNLMSSLQVKVTETNLDCSNVGKVFQNSFATEDRYTTSQLANIAENWVDIEDQPEIMEATIEDDIDAMEVEEQQVLTENEMNEMDDEEPAPNEEIAEEDKISYVQAQNWLQKICVNATLLGFDPIHLQRCMSEMREAQQKKPKRSTTLHDFFISNK